MVTSISRRLSKVEGLPQIQQERRVREHSDGFARAVKAGTVDEYLEPFTDSELVAMHNFIMRGSDIDWHSIPMEVLEMAAQNKISTQQLRKKYPLKEVTSS